MSSFNNHRRNNEDKLSNNGYPDLKPHPEKILIIIKAAPIPSKSYTEVVCTVGVTKSGKLIRLYPVPYRYLYFPQRYKEYQWIEVEIEKHKKDNRIDSYKPNIKTLRVIGNPLPAGRAEQRKKIILPLISSNLEEIKNNFRNKKISLGVFKPKKIKLKIERDDERWSNGHEKMLKQRVLFGEQPKKLEKVPFKFSYEFSCNNKDCKGHIQKVVNWGINELYRNLKEKNPYSIDTILKKITQKWETEMWGENKDSYLIVGTRFPYASFLVLGVFWPPK